MKKLIYAILSTVPIWVTLLLLPYLPDQVPTHYDFNFKIDQIADKSEFVMMACVLSASALVMLLVVFIMEQRAKKLEEGAKKTRTLANAAVIRKFSWIYLFLTWIIIGIILILTFKNSKEQLSGNQLYLFKLLFILLGIFFIFLGNILPKTKRNWVIGVRVPWTLKNDLVWAKTHRAAGYLCVLMGLVIMITSIFVPLEAMGFVFMGAVTLFAIGSLVLSYKYYKQYGKEV